MKRFLALIILLALVITGAIYYFLFYSAQKNSQDLGSKGDQTATGTKNQNPFGLDNAPVSPTQSKDINPLEIGSDGTVTNADSGWKLVNITESPVVAQRQFNRTVIEVIDDEEVEKSVRGVEYIERTNGHISEFNLKTEERQKVFNFTQTGLQNAYFTSNEHEFISQTIGVGDVVATTLTKSDGTQTTLENNLSQVLVSPNSKKGADKLFIGKKTTTEYQGIIANKDGTGGKIVFRSPLREWWASWTGGNEVVLYSMPSNSSLGAAYTVNTETGETKTLTSRIPGLEVVKNPKNSSFIASGGTSNYIAALLSKDKDTTFSIAETSADKCAWSPSGKKLYCAVPTSIPTAKYPDDWNMGKMHFVDNITEINPETGAIVNTFDISLQNLDIRDVVVDDAGETISFIDKNNNSLWVLYK